MPRDSRDETAIKLHPVAELFPLMPEDELQSLADDIKANGLQVPIVVNEAGEILDGRHRALACERAGVEPVYVVSKAVDLVGLVASLNAKRRNLSSAQRAMSAAEAWDMVEDRRTMNGKHLPKNREKDGRAQQLAGMFGVSRAYIEQARYVLLNDPVTAGVIKAGGPKTLKDSYQAVKDKVMATSGEETILAEIRAADPELAAQVVEGKFTLPGALAEIRQRTEDARQKRWAAMKVLHTVMSLLSPHGGDPAPIVRDLVSNWDPEQFPAGTVKLTVPWLKACVATLEAVIKAKEGDSK